MQELESRIGYSFKDTALLKNAITHSSYANENRAAGAVCNERLEFLGDAVLGVLVADYLFHKFPDMPEGKMTRLRAELVCEKSLDAVAAALGLGEYLLLGKGEERGGGRSRPSILADAVEAVLAAIYLDGGMAMAESFVKRFILDVFESGENKTERDYKTELQELIQRKSGQVLEYRLFGESGPDHAKVFTIEALLNGERLSLGDGRSKKDAEQAAAKKALEGLE
ncbi:MAG: ribonuclease III [Oscillospiraceae bacterium]